MRIFSNAGIDDGHKGSGLRQMGDGDRIGKLEWQAVKAMSNEDYVLTFHHRYAQSVERL
jgi:hypothetical protein